ncbi:YqgE/AlgH family protein [Chitinophaga lutea]
MVQAGILLQSTPLLNDSYFESAAIYVAEHNAKGALGFMINRPFPRNLNDLQEFSRGIPFPLFEGGPVDNEHLYFIHRRPDLISGSAPVAEGVFLGGDFSTTVRLINLGVLTERDVKIFIGYCGWDKDELEAEVAEGSWHVDPSPDQLF